MTAEEAKRAYQKEYRQKNREKINAYQRAWRKKNPERVAQITARYWTKKAQQAEEETE